MFSLNKNNVRRYVQKFEHSRGLINQEHYTIIRNCGPDALNNTNEFINKCLKGKTGKKNIQAVFGFIYNYQMDHILRSEFGEKYA